MHYNAIGKVFLSLCESTDTPISLGLWLRYKYSHEELARFRINPRDYNDSLSFGADYLCSTFLRKYKGLDTGIDTEKEAIQKFVTSEEQCLSTNKRLSNIAEGDKPRAEAILHSAQRKISAILGSFSFAKVLKRCEWTKGSTLDIPRRESFVDTKILKLPMTVTRGALPWIRLQMEHDPQWFHALTGIYPDGAFSLIPSCFQVVSGNKVTTVPKDSTTDRVIAVEPRANIFLQKGVGNYLRRRLNKFGIDLSKQDVNQFWAWKALDLDLATIDLSSASDTIAKELVFQLLPPDWSEYLNDIRSPYGLLPSGKEIRYEKFSSMGNGFTFELESLLFFAICEACQDVHREEVKWQLTSVYGDDIVVHQSAYRAIEEYLPWFGFTVNSAKSYHEGLFFESCGKHYFGGEDVTPVYQKEVLDEVEAIRSGNRLLRWIFRSNRPELVSGSWEILYQTFTRLHSTSLPPDADGDDGWLMPRFSSRYDPNHGYHCKIIRFKRRTFVHSDEALLAYSLRKHSWRNPVLFDRENLRSGVQSSLEERIGFLFADLDTEISLEVESGRFSFGRRWVHTSNRAWHLF